MIPFYGSDDPEMFAIERRAMDATGRVIERLDQILPDGVVLDIGAGNGFTAERLTSPTRTIVASEPAAGMVDSSKPLPWIRSIAQELPFRDGAFDAVYSTWAYFFPDFMDISQGLAEARRVTVPGGLVVVVDNVGDDEFSAMASRPGHSAISTWHDLGFDTEIIDTAFEFESLEEAERLLTLYFGDGALPALRIEYRVVVATIQVP